MAANKLKGTNIINIKSDIGLTSNYTIRDYNAIKCGKFVTLTFAINNGGNAFSFQMSGRVNPLCNIAHYKPSTQSSLPVFVSTAINNVTTGVAMGIFQNNGNVLCDLIQTSTREITACVTYMTDED